MEPPELSHDDAEYLFLRSESATTKTTLWLLAGCGALGLGVLGFCLALVADVNQLSMTCMTTLPMLFGIGAISASRALSRTPSQVGVGPQGIRLEGQRGKQSYSWEEIGWSTVTPTLMNTSSRLVIFDTQGKTLAKLGSGFDDYDRLVEIITQRVADKEDDTSARVQSGKGKRSALFMAAASVAFLALAAANVWMAHREQRAAELLTTAGVPGEARIERRFLAPNGVTPRLEYRITTPQGRSATRNAEVTRAYWDQLKEAATVPVVFVPSEPEISRLAMGEPEDTDFTDDPKVMYVLSAVIVCICCLFLVTAAMQWRGWDIDIDSKTHKISIKRFGTGR